MKKKKKRRLKKKLIYLLCVLLLACLAGLGYLIYDYMEGNKTNPYYLASETETVEAMDKEGNRFAFPRGKLVNIRNRRLKEGEEEYCQFTEDGKTYLVKEASLVFDRNSCVREKTLYALRDHVLSQDYDSYRIAGWVQKKEQLSVSGYHELKEDGSSTDISYTKDGSYLVFPMKNGGTLLYEPPREGLPITGIRPSRRVYAAAGGGAALLLTCIALLIRKKRRQK